MWGGGGVANREPGSYIYIYIYKYMYIIYVCLLCIQLQQVQEYKRLFAYFCFTPAIPGCTLPFFGHVLSQVKCPFGAMSCEVKLNTLQGSVITLDVPMAATVRELKSMLLEKHPLSRSD